MKKILGILMSIVMVAGFYACSDDDYTEHVSTLKVVESDVTFTNKGGSGYIDVESPTSITAKSTEDWCTVAVSGTKVTVTAESQPGIEGRNAQIVIYNATDSVKVPVNQSGAVFYITGEASYLVDGTSEISVTAKATKDYTISVSADWIHYEVGAKSIDFTFDANDGEKYRSGKFTITSVDGDEESIYFGELGTSFAGNYIAIWQQYNSAGTELGWYYTYASITDNGSNSYEVNGLVDEGSLPWTYTASTKLFDMANGVYIGDWEYNSTTYYLYTVKNYTNAAGTTNYITYNTTLSTYHIYFTPVVDEEDGSLAISFTRSSALASSYTDLGFYVNAFKAKTFSSANNIGWVYMFRYLTLYSID